ncbi:Basic 7S globulin [Sesamum alatum]|uniref:Basic 7S globulin n=1 Tax=Sesamum alatum TaxID=300844 RepID=A0AAE1XLS9_9LAMI|nr:Basic 7S globulin [Sesamum alatum]
MASTFNIFLPIIFLALISTTSCSHDVRAPFKPTSLVLPVRKDPATNLHVTNLRKRTPPVPVPLLLDLNGRFLWVTCDQNYSSSTYYAPFCHSTQCDRAGVHYCHKCRLSSARPGCHNNTCGVLVTNPFTERQTISELAQDVVSIPAIDQASNPSQWVTIPHFLFACAPSSLLRGQYPQSVQGVAALGHTAVALPMQLASNFGFQPQFSLCLSSSTTEDGGVFFGSLPSKVQPRALAYTPVSVGGQGVYYILVKSVKINNKRVPFNTSLISTTRGFKGTLISTTTPYSALEHSVFKIFTQFFADQLAGVPQVEAIPPFGLCFDANILPPTRVGTPNIDFVMQNKNVTWTFLGVDALVRVRPNVSCLAFVDAGSDPGAAITIGAYQLEDNFVHFDLSRSRVGFYKSRLSQPFRCSNFNFTGARLAMEVDATGE